jgi:hypothetical protein
MRNGLKNTSPAGRRLGNRSHKRLKVAVCWSPGTCPKNDRVEFFGPAAIVNERRIAGLRPLEMDAVDRLLKELGGIENNWRSTLERGRVEFRESADAQSVVRLDRLGVRIVGALRYLLRLACDRDDARPAERRQISEGPTRPAMRAPVHALLRR